MGKVIVKNILLKNHRDEIAADLGVIELGDIRQVTWEMIADTGAVAASLPKSVVEKLGLPKEREVRAHGFKGEVSTLNLHGDLAVYIDDRKAITQCLAIPSENAPSSLGQLVFEQIDYIVDCKNGRISPNPDSEPGMLTFDMF